MFKIYVDGSKRITTGKAAICYILRDIYGNILEQDSKEINSGVTSNVAEYEAVLWGIKQASEMGVPVTIYTDSQLVVGQVTQGWKCNKAHLLPLKMEAIQLIDRSKGRIKVNYISRAQNIYADKLCRCLTNNEEG